MSNRKVESLKPLPILSKDLPASMVRQEQLTSYAAVRAKLLLDCYRTGEANNPETYVAAIVAVLARYPEDVITQVTHPVTGLPSNGKGWLPSVKEVRDACDAAVEPMVQEEARLKRIKEQMEMRERMDRGERPTMAQLKDKYGADWGIGANSKPEQAKEWAKAPTVSQLAEHYRSKPGYINWLADRKKVLRGEIEEYHWTKTGE